MANECSTFRPWLNLLATKEKEAALSIPMPTELTQLCKALIFLALAALVSVAIMSAAPAIAHAEAPLYCNNYYHINEGCNGPYENLQYNETRNENGGCIAAQWYVYEEGYSKVEEVCEGRNIIYEIGAPSLAYPRCWNRSNAYDLIHCRYH